MSTITRERLRERARDKVKSLEFSITQTAFADSRAELEEELELARIALASLEAEPVAFRIRLKAPFKCDERWDYIEHRTPDRFELENCDIERLYTAPPAQVSVPLAIHDEDFEKALSVLNDTLDDCGDSERGLLLALDKAGIAVRSDACRAAMLQGADGKYPVIPDDVRRMDWLVSKTVDVREPMVYGSHSLFWSQTITDEEDDFHATKLREQIDAAMAAEHAAAPQQEVKP